jgi:acetolactate synthase-1/2/3 large subunit
VESSEELPKILAAAFRLAISGRPGPVLVDIPMDLQRADIAVPVPDFIKATPAPAGGPDAAREVLQALRSAQRPLILAGGGVAAAQATRHLRDLCAATATPVINSLLAVDALPGGHDLRAGLVGSYGNRWTNLAVGESDFILVLGSRLDIRQTGSEASFLTTGRRVIHVDVEAGEINNRVPGCQAVVAHLASFLDAVLRQASGASVPRREAWLSRIAELRKQWPDTAEIKDAPGINPNFFMRELSGASAKAASFAADVGQHQMWAGQSLELGPTQRFLTSGGMGAMGFALPAAIGASFAQPEAPHVVIAGDGGFQVNLQELQTVAHYRLPIKMVVMDNGCHGMVRQFQQCYFDSRYAGTKFDYSSPDFAAVAGAFGLQSATVANASELPAGLARLWADPKEPFLLQVKIDAQTNVYPKIAFGKPMTEMEPFVQPTEMEGT